MSAGARCVDVESARFFEEMRDRLGGGGDFAEAHVIAHVRWFTRGLETGDMDPLHYVLGVFALSKKIELHSKQNGIAGRGAAGPSHSRTSVFAYRETFSTLLRSMASTGCRSWTHQ